MSKKKSLRERLLEKKEDLKNSGGGFKTFMIPEGKTRFRIVFMGEDEDWALECETFFINKQLVISAATFGEKCGIMEGYEELKNSNDEDDRKFAAQFKPGTKYVTLAIKYKDVDGAEVDKENGVKPLPLAKGVYDAALDLWLDKENGDFTNPIEGYDLKFTRVGKGMKDTRYGVLTCKPSKAPKSFRGPYNLEEEIRKVIPTYKESKKLMEKHLQIGPEEETDKKESKKDKKKKKKKDL